MPIMDRPAPTPLAEQTVTPRKHLALSRSSQQFLRFGLVGCLNTLTDLLALNCLLWLWPTQNTALLLLANSLAYALGALNSFVLNRYWTFQHRGPTNIREVSRFALTTLAGIICNDLILGSLTNSLQGAHLSTTIWMNLAKLVAIGGTLLISYLGMRLWVFVQQPQQAPRQSHISGHFLQKGNIYA
ncbi:MAG: GtrA family protein, partial [Ktedonobacteraceae bacterium]